MCSLEEGVYKWEEYILANIKRRSLNNGETNGWSRINSPIKDGRHKFCVINSNQATSVTKPPTS